MGSIIDTNKEFREWSEDLINHVDSRPEMDGRYGELLEYVFDQDTGQMNGYHLQAIVQTFYISKGWETEWEPQIWGLRGDIAARKMDHDPQKIYTQCKCWMSKPIGCTVIWRLIAIAYTFRAEPALAYVGTLNEKAERLAKIYRVRLLDMETLLGDELPAPEEISEYDARMNPHRFTELFQGDMPPREIVAPNYMARRHNSPEYPMVDFGEHWEFSNSPQSRKRRLEHRAVFRRLGETIEAGHRWEDELALADTADVNWDVADSVVRFLVKVGVLEWDGCEIVKV